jgi:PAS domain S-box-containing protein
MAAEGKEGGPLQRSEERFRRVVESAPNAIVMIGHTGLIEMVNAEAERVFGYTRNELLGKPVEMLVPERSRSKHSNLRTSFFADSVSRPMGAGRDLYGLRKDGSEFPVEIGLNPIETEEGTMVLSAIVNISARKRLEVRIHTINSVLTHEINVARHLACEEQASKRQDDGSVLIGTGRINPIEEREREYKIAQTDRF